MTQNDILTILLKPESQNILNQIGQIHIYTKHYFLLAEELSEDGALFLQPMKEHRDAYDHISRIFSLHFRTVDDSFNINDYVLDNLKKACGHEYRAFFDTADWLTFICRKFIRESLSSISVQSQYKNVFSEEEFNNTKEYINNVPQEIARYRENKDISSETKIEEIDKYKETLDRLINIYLQIKTL